MGAQGACVHGKTREGGAPANKGVSGAIGTVCLSVLSVIIQVVLVHFFKALHPTDQAPTIEHTKLYVTTSQAHGAEAGGGRLVNETAALLELLRLNDERLFLRGADGAPASETEFPSASPLHPRPD